MIRLTLVYLAMTKICDEHLEELALGEGELLDALPEEVLLVHGVSVLLPPHQLPLNPAVDERSLGGRIRLLVLLILLLNVLDYVVEHVIFQTHNLEIFGNFRPGLFLPHTSLTSYRFLNSLSDISSRTFLICVTFSRSLGLSRNLRATL